MNAYLQHCTPKAGINYFLVYGFVLQSLLKEKQNKPAQAQAILQKSMQLWQKFPQDYLGVKHQVESMLAK